MFLWDSRLDGDGPLGVAEDPWVTIAARVACELAAALIAHHVCSHADYWPKHCPANTTRRVRDTWDKNQYVDISCNTLQELTCGSGAFATDRLARLIVCGKVF